MTRSRSNNPTTTKDDQHRGKNPSVLYTFVAALFIRLLITLYSTWHDRNFVVKYTDIDYVVFTDASRFVSQNSSPYLRSTYRYTPLLAYLLLPNIYLYENFGKILFSLSDILVALLVYKFLNRTGLNREKDQSFYLKVTCFFVLFNPITINTSTRGNADQLVVLLSLLFVYAVISGWSALLAGCLFGLAVHFKIYPVIYGPLIMIYYYYNCNVEKKKNENNNNDKVDVSVTQRWKKQFMFCMGGGLTLVAFTALFYVLYGFTFLYESYLYHVTRSDHRHNFSVYFYQMYLKSSPEGYSIPTLFDRSLSVLAFLPQIALMCMFYLVYWFQCSRNKTNARFMQQQLFVTMFLVTFVFVTFNKVCTVQYFIWYMALLSFVVQRVRELNNFQFSKTNIVASALLVVTWIVGQGVWLSQGYELEFLGNQVFINIWRAGLGFFLVNITILCVVTASTMK